MQILDVEQKYSDVWKALAEIPWGIAKPCKNGIHLSRKTFLGLERRGPQYLEDWLNENHVQLSINAILIINAIGFYHEFITWDELFTYLKTHNCGALKSDIKGTLDAHVPAPKQLEDRDKDWLESQERREAIASSEAEALKTKPTQTKIGIFRVPRH